MDKNLLNVNGQATTVICDPKAKLADVLRRQVDLTGTKVACGQGQCGCCSVVLNGKAVRSCMTVVNRVPDESEITTIEGIGQECAAGALTRTHTQSPETRSQIPLQDVSPSDRGCRLIVVL
jgi:aerobic-type carbon monoxide dehydrogenase small subunit (CoxS/CutS family)